jgi:hypothetical protein
MLPDTGGGGNCRITFTNFKKTQIARDRADPSALDRLEHPAQGVVKQAE